MGGSKSKAFDCKQEGNIFVFLGNERKTFENLMPRFCGLNRK